MKRRFSSARRADLGCQREDICDPCEEQGNEIATPLAAGAANSLEAYAYRDSENVGETLRIGSIQLSWAGFEVVAAWL